MRIKEKLLSYCIFQGSIDLSNEFCASYVNVQEQKRFKLFPNNTIVRTTFRQDNKILKYTGCEDIEERERE